MSKRVRTLVLVTLLLTALLALSGCAAPTQGQDLTRPPEISWQGFVDLVAKALILLNNGIVALHVGYSWGWAIIVFTIIMKLVTLPLTLKQLQSTKATQELQPKLQELQQKYKNDRNKLAEEQMKLYKESGVNPMGGCLPLLIQMPILFALYQSLYVLANGATVYPEWSVSKLQGAAFYWIPNLTLPSLSPAEYQGINFQGNNWIGGAANSGQWGLLIAYFSLPVIMILSQLVLQKMAQPVTANKPKGGQPDQTQMMGQMMMFMPIMFGYITLGLPAGLTLYWSVSNILSVVQQYFVTGWGGLGDWLKFFKPRPAPALVQNTTPSVGEPEAGPAADKMIKRRRRRK